MRDADRKRFAAALAGAAEIYGKGVSESAAEIWFAALRDVPIDAYEAAMMRHMRDPDTGRFMPRPADIIAQIRGTGANDGRPEADEAFALVPKTEHDTAVWTDEMSVAWYGGASDLYESDRVGARMAFRASYDRAVRVARGAGEPVKWTVTLGLDPRGREGPVRKAIADGRLSPSAVLLLVGPLEAGAAEIIALATKRLTVAA